MGNIEVDKLQALHNAITEQIASSGTCNEKLDFMVKELNTYEISISSFFVGKESDIKKIYSAIRSNAFPYNKIRIIDINLAAHQYSDYFEGLCQFAKMVTGLSDSDEQNKEAIASKIQSVGERDKEFVDSLFNGTAIPYEESDISTAMKNVEVLIDIYQKLPEFIKISKDILESITNTTEYKSEVASGYEVFLNSIRNYSVQIIEFIIRTYESIENSMEVRESVKGSPIIPKYQLF
jgi:hypothetical protein